jgi:predicted metal-dependent phosphoesterase TrpH
VLVRKGYVNSTQAAFDKYLGQGGAVFFDKETITPRRALEMVREAGGLPVLAHPVQLRKENDAQLELAIKQLVDFGLAGVEVIHSDHDERMVGVLSELADRYGLLKTGGSDFHGGSKPTIRLGMAAGRRVPREMFEALRERLGKV